MRGNNVDYRNSFSFETTVGEQVYFSPWYMGAMSKSLTMWIVPISLFFSLGFGSIGMYWFLWSAHERYTALWGDITIGLSFFAGALCSLSLIIVGIVWAIVDYKSKRIGIRTAFDAEAALTIEIEEDGLRLKSGGAAVALEWQSVTHIILFNGTVLIGANAMYMAATWKHFVDIDGLIGFLRFCRKRTTANAQFKDVSFDRSFKDRRLREFFKSA